MEDKDFGTLLKMDHVWYYLITGSFVYKRDDEGNCYRTTESCSFFDQISRNNGFFDWLWIHEKSGYYVDSYLSLETAERVFKRCRKVGDNEELVIIDVREF